MAALRSGVQNSETASLGYRQESKGKIPLLPASWHQIGTDKNALGDKESETAWWLRTFTDHAENWVRFPAPP